MIQKKLLVSQSVIRDRSVDALQEGQQIVMCSAAPDSHIIVNLHVNTGFFRRKPVLSATFKNYCITTVSFQYGPTTAYGTVLGGDPDEVEGDTNTPVTVYIEGLTSGEPVHFRVVGETVLPPAGAAENSTRETRIFYGEDMTFTPGTTPATVAKKTATGVTAGKATLNGTVNANSDSTTVTIQYGRDTGYGSTVTASPSPVTGTADTSVSGLLTALMPNTTYHYRVVGVKMGGGGLRIGHDIYDGPGGCAHGHDQCRYGQDGHRRDAERHVM